MYLNEVEHTVTRQLSHPYIMLVVFDVSID